jgi:hypothetical protein
VILSGSLMHFNSLFGLLCNLVNDPDDDRDESRNVSIMNNT